MKETLGITIVSGVTSYSQMTAINRVLVTKAVEEQAWILSLTLYSSNLGPVPLGKAESYQLLIEWNNTQADYPKNKCIHQLFEYRKTPDTPLQCFEEKQLTYRELNKHANKSRTTCRR